MAGQPDDRGGPHDVPGHAGEQVLLAEVQHIRARHPGQVRPVVDREQRAMPGASTAEHLEVGQLLRRLEALVPQLDDVHPGAEHGIGELRQVALLLPRVGAQVQPCRRQPLPRVIRHTPHPTKAPASHGRTARSTPNSEQDSYDEHAERARRLEILQRTESEFDPVPFDAEAARIFGRVTAAAIAADHKPRRRIADLMIAATAVAAGLALYTTNPADFVGLDALLRVVPVTRPTVPHDRPAG